MEMTIKHALILDWKSLLKESNSMTPQEKAVLQELIMRPYIRRAIQELRDEYNLPVTGGIGSNRLESDSVFLGECENRIRKKFGFPESFSGHIRNVVIYGKICVPATTRQRVSLREKINDALETANYFGKHGDFLYSMPDAPLNPEIFKFKHGGTTVGIDPESFTVTIRQTPTGTPDELQELSPLIEGYQNALRMHCEHYRDKGAKEGNRGEYSFIINCLAYQAVIEERIEDNAGVLAFVQARLEEFLPEGADVHEMKEFNTSAFNKRLQRLRCLIREENVEKE